MNMDYKHVSLIVVLMFSFNFSERACANVLGFSGRQLNDGYVQLELLNIIGPKVNEAISRYEFLVERCVGKINETIDVCAVCANSSNCAGNSKPPKREPIIYAILNKAKDETGKLLTGINRSIDRATKSAFSQVKSALEDLKNFEKKIREGAKKVVKVVKNAAKKAKGFFKKVFGFGKRTVREKRALNRCVLNSCQSCRRINSDVKTIKQIMNDVCRADIKGQNKAEAEAKKLQKLVNAIDNKSSLIISRSCVETTGTDYGTDYFKYDAESADGRFMVRSKGVISG